MYWLAKRGVAAVRRNLERVEHACDRRILEIRGVRSAKPRRNSLSSFSSFTTSVMSGKSGSPLSCGYSMGSPKQLSECELLLRGDFLAAKEDHQMVQEGLMDL